MARGFDSKATKRQVQISNQTRPYSSGYLAGEGFQRVKTLAGIPKDLLGRIHGGSRVADDLTKVGPPIGDGRSQPGAVFRGPTAKRRMDVTWPVDDVESTPSHAQRWAWWALPLAFVAVISCFVLSLGDRFDPAEPTSTPAATLVSPTVESVLPAAASPPPVATSGSGRAAGPTLAAGNSPATPLPVLSSSSPSPPAPSPPAPSPLPRTPSLRTAPPTLPPLRTPPPPSPSLQTNPPEPAEVEAEPPAVEPIEETPRPPAMANPAVPRPSSPRPNPTADTNPFPAATAHF